MAMDELVRLGNAKIKCVSCQAENNLNPVELYMCRCIEKLQFGNSFTIRTTVNKLALAESILGVLASFKIKEYGREKVVENGKDYIDIKAGR